MKSIMSLHKERSIAAIKHAIFFIAFLVMLECSAQLSLAESYIIDPEHSKISFRVKHMGIGWVSGEFTEFGGIFEYDPKNLKTAKVEAEIKAKSIDTDSDKRDRHLKSEAFLNTPTFKSIRFHSSEILGEDPENFQIKGVLTIRDTAKEVILEAQHGGNIVDPWGVPRSAFQATTKISRKDFGLTWNRVLESGALLVGEEIEVLLDIQGVGVKDNSPKLVTPEEKKENNSDSDPAPKSE